MNDNYTKAMWLLNPLSTLQNIAIVLDLSEGALLYASSHIDRRYQYSIFLQSSG